MPSWHLADFLSGQLRDAESTKKLHNSNKTHFDLIWPSWHLADFLSGQLRDAESTKKLHNSNKTHFDLIWHLDYKKIK